jgi:hypothetical protein
MELDTLGIVTQMIFGSHILLLVDMIKIQEICQLKIREKNMENQMLFKLEKYLIVHKKLESMNRKS